MREHRDSGKLVAIETCVKLPITYINRPVSQMRALLAACRELALDYDTLPKALYGFEHKTLYCLIHALYTHSVVFWHISNKPHMIS